MADEEESEQERKTAMAQVDYIYVSGVQMFSNNWDLRFVFGDRQPDDTQVPKVGLVMSHQHGKAMLQALAKHIEGIEKMFGPIEFEAKPVVSDQESAES